MSHRKNQPRNATEVTPPARLPIIKSLTVAHEAAARTGLLAYLVVAHSGIEFTCVLRITRQRKFVLAFPERRSWHGRSHVLVEVVEPGLRAHILKLAKAELAERLQSRSGAMIP